MQVGLHLELAHELGILPVACVHSAHPVVHQCPTLHASGLSLGRGTKRHGRTYSEMLLNPLGISPWQNKGLLSTV